MVVDTVLLFKVREDYIKISNNDRRYIVLIGKKGGDVRPQFLFGGALFAGRKC